MQASCGLARSLPALLIAVKLMRHSFFYKTLYNHVMSYNLNPDTQPVNKPNIQVEITQAYHLCLAWNWEYDLDFICLLEAACREAGVDLLQITPTNLDGALESLKYGELYFLAFLDRAGDSDPRFHPLAEWARRRPVLRLNGFQQARKAWNKAEMGVKLKAAGLQIPRTLVLPSLVESPDLPQADLDWIGSPFVVKPSHGGGGRGVVTGAVSWEQVLSARSVFADDQYLLQEQICPAFLDGRPAWFRVIYCAGETFPCWWDPLTHRYAPVTVEEEACFSLHRLRDILCTVHTLGGLDLFSTEIALTAERGFLVIDYVNDPIDLRLQSKAADGVPDEMVQGIASGLARSVATRLNRMSPGDWFPRSPL